MHDGIVQFSILSFIKICLYYSSNIVATTSKNDYSPIFFLDSCSFFINVITQQNNSEWIFFLLKAKEQEDLSVVQERSPVLQLSHSSCSAGCPGFS